MHGVALTLMLATAGSPCVSQARQGSPLPRPGARPRITFAALRRGFRQPDRLYAPFAFWFWDAPLDPQRAARQAAEMLRQGFNPGYAHPRTGLPAGEWLTSKWFRTLDAALRQVEAAGGYMGYCDEYDWPSGRANGRVLAAHPELKAVSLQWQILELPGGTEARLPASFFTVAGQADADGRLLSRTLRLVGAGGPFDWRVPAGRWRAYSFRQYHHPGMDGSPVNYLDDRLAPAFMEIAYKPYERYFGRRLGRRMAGLFIDNEGDYGWKLAWSDHLARHYRGRFGRDIRLWMPLLVDRDAEGRWAKARWEWMDAVSDIYADGFFGRISRWCESRGMYCTMHVWEESLPLQAEAVGDYFKVMRSVTMPGTDSLVRKPLEPQEFKETQSVSEFENRRACSEVLGVVGWEMTPTLLKQTANALAAWGVSHVMPHGVYMRRELNTIPYPPDFFAENPYWPYFHLWTDFVRRASYVTSHGHTVPDLLLVNPMDSLWATSGEWLFAPQPDEARRATEINAVYFDALKRLAGARVEFLVTDRHYLRRMAVRPGGRLTLGSFSFETVVLPPMVVLPLDVARKIVAFARAGGAVYTLGELPSGSTDNGMGDPAMTALMGQLRALPSVVACRAGLAAELARPGTRLASRVAFEAGAFPMLQSHRRIDDRDFYWLGNNGETRQECVLRIRGARGAAFRWNCETGRITSVPTEPAPEGSRVRLTFQPLEAFFLVFDSSIPPHRPVPAARAAGREVRLDGRWAMRIDRNGQPSTAPDTVPFFTVPWRASWLEVRDAARFRQAVVLPDTPAEVRLWVTADESFQLYINGQAAPGRPRGSLWNQVLALDATRLLRKGRNILAVRASKPEGAGGLILQGWARLRDGRTVWVVTGPSWQSARDDAPATRFGRWIWGQETRANQTVRLRRAFTLPAGARVRRATIALTADNRFTLFVNNRRVGGSEPWMEPAVYDISRLLRDGRNVLAVEARNDDGAAGLLAGLSVETADGATACVVSDGEWRATEAASGAWTAPDFDDAGWARARVVGEYGDAPWGRFDEERMQDVPRWAMGDAGAAGWRPAAVVGAPPAGPWKDAPDALLAGAKRPLGSWLDLGLDRFTGYVDYRKVFRLEGPPGRRTTLDLGQVRHMAEVWVNGRRVGARLWPPFTFDITTAVRPGVNTVRVRVGNLMTGAMAQYADRGTLTTWGWGPPPARECYDAGLFGPVLVRAEDAR